MLDVAILGQVALGYSPFIDRNRSVSATRLSVFPLRPDASLDVAQLLHAVGDVWPASGGNVSLNVVSESLLHDLLQATLGQPDGRGAELHGLRSGQRRIADPPARQRQHAAAEGPAERRAAARSAAVLQAIRSSISPTSAASARARPPERRDALDRARAVGRAHRGRHGGGVRRAAPTPCSAGRSTTRSTPPRRAPARRWRSPTCRWWSS